MGEGYRHQPAGLLNLLRNIMRTILLFYIFITLVACSEQKADQNNRNQTVLVFSKTEGYRHDSIPDGTALFESFAAQDPGLNVITTEEATRFEKATLEKISAVVFLNTTGDVLNEAQQNALREFIQNGGGFMGIHAATDTEYGWPWYGQMIGARFASHPAIQKATLHVLSRDHPATAPLPDKWIRRDEWYNFKEIQEHINPLLNLDESTYEGGENGANHPAAWYHEFEGGRIFYTAGGHTAESYSDSLFIEHLRGGLQSVLN